VAISLQSFVLYLCGKRHTPHLPIDFDVLRYLAYLSHWKYALVHEQALTEAVWIFTYRGPESGGLFDATLLSEGIRVFDHDDYNRNFKVLYMGETPKIDETVQRVLDFVLEKESKMSERELQRLVYSTFPVMTTPRFACLDLVKKSKDYVETLRSAGTSEDEIKRITSVNPLRGVQL
jgi:hypothetical protein